MERYNENDYMKDELDQLLSEIPRVTSNYQSNSIDDNGGHNSFGHYRNGASPMSGYSLRSNGLSGSFVSGGHAMSVSGLVTPPPVEEQRSHLSRVEGLEFSMNGWTRDRLGLGLGMGMGMGMGLGLGLGIGDSVDELGLCTRINGMRIGGEMDNFMGSNGFQGFNQLNFEASRRILRTHGAMHPAMFNSRQNFGVGDALEPLMSASHPDIGFPQWNSQNQSPNVPWQNHYFNATSSSRNISSSFRPPRPARDLCYAQKKRVSNYQGSRKINGNSFLLENQLRRSVMMGSAHNWRSKEFLNAVTPRGNFGPLQTEDSVIFQGECSNFMHDKNFNSPRGQINSYVHGNIQGKCLDRRSQANGRLEIAENVEDELIALKYNSLAEAQGDIHTLAKDQHGCRFLQNMFHDDSPEDVQLIFKEIVDHAVELTMNPFANYLIQKLLVVCSEEQKLQFLLKVTEKRGELVKICLNIHGTRVVQKLIETLKVKEQIKLLISALQPGFLDLFMDVNGNHIIGHCLLYFSVEDNRHIFTTAATYCLEIATHHHGCCILPKCISYSTGQFHENLVTKISVNGLLLAQDRYGNYVVQFVLDLENPSATSNLIAQFEGQYVNLSKQKCGSHVVQRCLAIFEAENRSRVVHELLSSGCFEKLLEDPYANYVIKTALEVSQGPLKNTLVEAIEPHREKLRNTPYAKKICSLLSKK